MAMRVAVLADSHLQRRILREFLGSHGHEVVLNADPARLTPAELGDCTPDAWLVDLLRMDAHQEALLEHLYGQDAPVLVGEGEAPQAHSDDYARWERSLEKNSMRWTARKASLRRLCLHPRLLRHPGSTR